MKIFNALSLFALFCCGSLKIHAQLNWANNDPTPSAAFVDSPDLCSFQDNPVFADGSTSFTVRAGLYNTLLNLVGTSKEVHAKMYGDQIAPFITYSQDDQGNYHYTIVPGKEKVVLGYSKRLDTTKFRYLFDSTTTQDDLNQDSTVWVYLNSNNNSLARENCPVSGLRYQQPINSAEGEYDFYQTANAPSSGGDQNFSGELWVGMKDDGSPMHDSTLTANTQNGFINPSDAPSALKVQDGSMSEKENDGVEKDPFPNITRNVLTAGTLTAIAYFVTAGYIFGFNNFIFLFLTPIPAAIACFATIAYYKLFYIP